MGCVCVCVRRRAQKPIRAAHIMCAAFHTHTPPISAPPSSGHQCIISHSVDYVQELQRTVAAYKRICHGSPPPLDDVEGSRISATHAHVHDHEDIGSENADGVDSDSNSNVERGEGERETTLSEERSAGPDDPEVESQESNISATVSGTASAPSGWTRCHAKCQRHWGSNNPIKLNRQQLHSKRRSQSIAELAKEEKMALAHIITDDKRIPTMSGGRAHSVDGETTIQQDVAFSDKVHTCVGCEPSDKLDSDSDLELDEWTPTQSHNGRRYSSRAAFAGSIFSPQKRPCEDVGYLVQSPECETEGPGQPSRSADLYTNKSAYGDVQTPSTKRLRGHHVRGEMARSMDGRVRERDSTDCEDCVSLLSAGRSHTVAFAASKDERQEFTEKDDGPQRIPTGLGLLADLSAQGAQR